MTLLLERWHYVLEPFIFHLCLHFAVHLRRREHSIEPRVGSGAVSKWVICACDSLVDFGAV